MSDQPITLSVTEAAALVGLKRTEFYHWRRRNGIERVPGTSEKRPRYYRDDIERAARGHWKPEMKLTPVEAQRLAQEAAEYAERGLDWPPR